MNENPPSAHGIVLADYQILEKIGEGAMGIVYRAHQKSLDRPVALKVLRPELALDQTFVERLKREARATAQLEHPHLLRALAVGEEGRTHYFAMELVEGGSGRDAAERGGLPEDKVREIGHAIGQALAYVHERGLVHRDVKPANILLGKDGSVRLADLGLSRKTIQSDETLSRPGTTLGTPVYMAPEQILDASSVGPAGDVYGLAASLVYLATGERPFRGSTLLEILAAKEAGDLGVEGISPELQGLLLRALDLEPGRRPTATEFAAMLVGADAEPPTSGSGRRPRIALGIAVCALCVALFLVVPKGFDWLRTEPVSTSDLTLPPAGEGAVSPTAVTTGPTSPELLPNGIAVLPFKSLSANPEHASFADAMHDALIHQLAGIPDLNVIARSSIWGYDPAKESLKALGRRLRVGNVVEGSVQYEDGRVRIQATLVDPSTGSRSWAKSFERPYDDVLEMQAEIATAIARTLQVESVDFRTEGRKQKTSPEALMFFAKARARSPNILPGMPVEFFAFLKAALDADPEFAHAHGVLSFALALNLGVVQLEGMDLETHERVALSHAEQAMSSPDGAAYGNAARALIAEQHRDWEGAALYWRRAVAIDPNEFDILDDYARYMAFRGDFETANAIAQRAMDLNPTDTWIESIVPYYRGDLREALAKTRLNRPIERALLLSGLGRNEEAVAALDWIGSTRPAMPAELAAACYVLHKAGRGEEAEEWCRRVDSLAPGSAPQPFLHLARYFAALGRQDEAAVIDVLSEIESNDAPAGPLGFYYILNTLRDPLADRPAVVEIRRRLGYRG